MNKSVKLPIGIEDFEKIRTEGFYYVDKTSLIKELLNNWGEVNLFTRPRRFGKSLNMNMLKSFFEFGCNTAIFEGLEIMREQKICNAYMGKFPVISITLKGVAGDTFETARAMLCSVIGREAKRFHFLLEGDRLGDIDRKQYQALVNVSVDGSFIMPDGVLANSLLTLSELLQIYYGRKVIILIDEYDVPLDKAQQFGYYDKMVALLRGLFGQALKGNPNLYFAVLTGCLRVSKESIFTGLNNPKICSITDAQFDEYFGFSDIEVRAMTSYYGQEDKRELIKEWYDGYHFGNTDVYCPWDVISYLDLVRSDPDASPRAFWANTSGNDIIRHFIQKAKKGTRHEIEQLLEGESIRKKIKQELTYRDLYENTNNLWSVLFATGYLTCREQAEDGEYWLEIPNLEVRQIFIEQVIEWFQEEVYRDAPRLDAFCEAFPNADGKAIEEQFNAYLGKTISIRDTSVHKNKKENFYHGILLGLLSHREDWSIESNVESGEGYSDIMVEIEEENIGIVIEVKYVDNDDLEKGCREALRQIEERNYAARLRLDGKRSILKYGIACCKKHSKVMLVQD